MQKKLYWFWFRTVCAPREAEQKFFASFFKKEVLACQSMDLERDELSLITPCFGEQFHGSVESKAIQLQAILL